jgi:hypothetical protein
VTHVTANIAVNKINLLILDLLSYKILKGLTRKSTPLAFKPHVSAVLLMA